MARLNWKGKLIIWYVIMFKKKKSATYNYPICGVQSVSSFAFMMNENISAGFCNNVLNIAQKLTNLTCY